MTDVSFFFINGKNWFQAPTKSPFQFEERTDSLSAVFHPSHAHTKCLKKLTGVAILLNSYNRNADCTHAGNLF